MMTHPLSIGRCSALAFVALLTLASCGGEDRGRPGGEVPDATPVDQCAVERAFELQPLVTFERSEGDLGCQVPNRKCEFYFNYDTVLSVDRDNGVPAIELADHCESLEPTRALDPEQLLLLADGPLVPLSAALRCGSPEESLRTSVFNVARCVSAQTGRLGWRGSLELKFTPTVGTATLEMDVSEWDGIGLWIRKGSPNTNPSFVLTVSDMANDALELDSSSDPHCGCRLDEGTGIYNCSKDPPLGFPDALKCDPFGIAITLTDEWTFVPAYFSAMRQKGFGYPAPGGLDKTQIRRLQFLFTSGNIDFVIDDISLFREK